jgi:hypothetical protein
LIRSKVHQLHSCRNFIEDAGIATAVSRGIDYFRNGEFLSDYDTLVNLMAESGMIRLGQVAPNGARM